MSDHNRHKLRVSEIKATLDVLTFTGEERLSQPFKYTIEFTCTEQDLAPAQILGRKAWFSLYGPPPKFPQMSPDWLTVIPEPPLRTVYGVVTGLKRLSDSRDEARYEIILQPRLALLDRGKQYRIYQKRSVPEIVESILLSRHGFKNYDLNLQLQREYPKREQVMQYGESDLAFITRLLAEVGIWYRFVHHNEWHFEIAEFCDHQRFYQFDIELAREHATQWAEWLLPISSDCPAGQDPGYDDDFQLIREEVNKLSGADPDQVIQLAQKVLTQTGKDLRVATYYLWARLHKNGERGLAEGLSLIAALVEGYAEVLPARVTSRKMALEWLTSGKVLDSLSLYPEVVNAEAERTVAALAWLEKALEAWPEDQRPDLCGLHGALSARLAQSGGTQALVPQKTVSQESTALLATPMASPKSGRDLLNSGRALACYLREKPEGWLAAHRLMKSLRWDTIQQPPPLDTSGNTRLDPPRGEYPTRLKRLYQQQNWLELMDKVEQMYGEGVNHFWLDLQWYLCQALSKQPAPQDSWADIVKRDLGMMLERLPGMETLRWSNGTPCADETTREWIAQHVSGNRPQQYLPVPATGPAIADSDILSLEAEALAQADTNGIEQALA